MKLEIGKKAPLFHLQTKKPEGLSIVELADYVGKRPIVLLFYPFSFTSACTKEMCSLSENKDVYNEIGATVFAISVDSPFVQAQWAKENGITVPLLSDFNKEVACAYGVLYEEFLGFRGVAKRSVFVIGTNGNIAYSWASEDPQQMPNFDEVQEAVIAAK